MSDGKPLDRPDIEADVDARLTEVWMLLFDSQLIIDLKTLYADHDQFPDDEALNALGQIMRACYLAGYRDALQELGAGTPGLLLDTHNFRLI